MTRPVFVVGKPRSGTTFMWSFLVGFSSFVEPFVRSDFTGKGRRYRPCGKWTTSETGCFVKDYEHGVKALSRALAECRKPVLIEKSPAHTKHIDRIAESFPDARFIYMRRPIAERYVSFNRYWPTEEERFYASDKGWDPPEGTLAQLSDTGTLIVVEFAEMKRPLVLRSVVDFVFGPDQDGVVSRPGAATFETAMAYAESRPVGLPWAQQSSAIRPVEQRKKAEEMPFPTTHTNTDWSILQLFPRFGPHQVNGFERGCSLDDREALDEMFSVDEVIHPKVGAEHVISTSIYCRPHNPGAPRIAPITEENLRKRHRGARGAGCAMVDLGGTHISSRSFAI